MIRILAFGDEVFHDIHIEYVGPSELFLIVVALKCGPERFLNLIEFKLN